MSWFTFSLLSITALAVAELMQQKILHSDKHFDERTSAVLVFFLQALLTIPIILVTGISKSLFLIFTFPSTFYVILAALIANISMVYYLRSFKVKNISISNIFVSISTIVSTTLGIIFFNEGYYFYKLLGIFLILSAIVSLNIKNFQLEKNHYNGLIAGVLLGIVYSLDKKVILTTDPLIYMFWALSLVTLFGFLFNPKLIISKVKKAKRKDFMPIVLSGLGYFFYNIFTFNAYASGGEVGRVDAINNSQVFVIILVEYFVFKHTEGIVRKLLTAVVAFLGVLILGYL